jgi:hypothetical protein
MRGLVPARLREARPKRRAASRKEGADAREAPRVKRGEAAAEADVALKSDCDENEAAAEVRTLAAIAAA